MYVEELWKLMYGRNVKINVRGGVWKLMYEEEREN